MHIRNLFKYLLISNGSGVQKMPAGRHKSRTFRRVKVKTPGGKTITSYRKRKPAKALCSETKKPLHGVARGKPSELKKLPKTKKRPERPYGGVLSSSAMRKKMKAKAKTI